MNIVFQSINYKADIKLKNFAKKKINKMNLFYKKIINVFISTKIENSSNRINKYAEIKIGIPGKSIIVKKRSGSFEKAIKTAVVSAQRIIKKKKEKLYSF